MTSLRVVATIAVIACLGACATIPEDQCGRTDWYELGVTDGRAGHPPERLAKHREACARVKVEPDEARYAQGRRAGLVDYCQPDNAFRDGLAGNDYHGVCDATFARNHRAAHDVAQARKEIEQNRSAIAWREAEIRGDKASDARRNNLRSEIRDLDRQRETLRDRLHFAERELERVRSAPVAAPPPPPPPRAAPPPPPPPRAEPMPGNPGSVTGTLTVAGTDAPLHFAYTFVAPDPLGGKGVKPVLLLTAQAIPADQLRAAPSLDRVVAALPHYVLVMRGDGRPAAVTLIVRHPRLGAATIVERDAARSGVARFDAYGDGRIAGVLGSPQGGKAPFAWNGQLRMNVRFDAPFVRRWGP